MLKQSVVFMAHFHSLKAKFATSRIHCRREIINYLESTLKSKVS